MIVLDVAMAPCDMHHLLKTAVHGLRAKEYGRLVHATHNVQNMDFRSVTNIFVVQKFPCLDGVFSPQVAGVLFKVALEGNLCDECVDYSIERKGTPLMITLSSTDAIESIADYVDCTGSMVDDFRDILVRAMMTS